MAKKAEVKDSFLSAPDLAPTLRPDIAPDLIPEPLFAAVPTLSLPVADLTAIRDALVALGSGSPESMVHRKQIASPALEILNAVLPAE